MVNIHAVIVSPLTGHTGRVFGLKLILFGTKDDPLKNNTHVDRRPKEAETVEVSRRKRGQNC